MCSSSGAKFARIKDARRYFVICLGPDCWKDTTKRRNAVVGTSNHLYQRRLRCRFDSFSWSLSMMILLGQLCSQLVHYLSRPSHDLKCAT